HTHTHTLHHNHSLGKGNQPLPIKDDHLTFYYEDIPLRNSCFHSLRWLFPSLSPPAMSVFLLPLSLYFSFSVSPASLSVSPAPSVVSVQLRTLLCPLSLSLPFSLLLPTFLSRSLSP